jgi:hypothetical protein
MYYDKIFRIWVLDLYDYSLISLFIGSLIASRLKKYFSEKIAMERLKSSIINKSGLVRLKTPISRTKEAKIKQIYRFALDNRGGQFEEFQADYKLSNEVFNLAQNIRDLVERLALFLKRKKLRGMAKIFFKGSRLMLELILYNCNISISYGIIGQGLDARLIIMTVSVGGALGFALSWFSVGTILVSPPVLISVFLLRTATQQISNQRDYLEFKKIVNKMLDDDELKETIKAVFTEGEGLIPSSGTLKMEPLDFDKKSAPKQNSNFKSDEDLEKFIKTRMKDQLGVIENPTEGQLQEIIQKTAKRKPQGKTVFFRDFIDENPYEGGDFSHSDIIDAEILEEAIRMKSDNEL